MFCQQIVSRNIITFSNSNPTLFSHRSQSPFVPRSLRFQPLESQSRVDGSLKFPFQPIEFPSKSDNEQSLPNDENDDEEKEKEADGSARDDNLFNDENPITGIHVPRQRYISVSKAELLEAILPLFESLENTDEFLRVSMCLDSIIHAEHKVVLEEMRMDYALAQLSQSKANKAACHLTSEEVVMSNQQTLSQRNSFSSKNMEQNEKETDVVGQHLQLHYDLDLRSILDSYFRRLKSSSVGNRRFDKAIATSAVGQSRVAAATRFQRAFMKLLRSAQFEELSARELLLTSALNTDYILTLPIYIDWKKASESNAIIFRRGYATERQKGLLLVEKLDYLQSRLLQRIFFTISRPIKKAGKWINEALKSTIQFQEMEHQLERLKLWVEELSMPQKTNSYSENSTTNDLAGDQISDSDLPIWLAAQRAVPRYEGLLSSVLGPRERLLRKFLIWTGFIQSVQERSFNVDGTSKASEPYMRPSCLSRISLGDIWKPATRAACGNNLWKMFKTSVSILFSQSLLQEPAFEELILLYSEEMGGRESEDKDEVPSLQLKIYEKIPIPDLPVIFPHKKLSFRILDTVRLDVASIVGLLAFVVNYKFENVLSSPSALLLDVIATGALILYVTRVALGYKQTWDRYQLLVNKTLYEKTIASGFGSVHFLLDASEQQQYKEAILAFAILLQSKKHENASQNSIRDKCERFMYDKFMEKVEMPIDKALDTLLRLGIVTEEPLQESTRLQALSCSKAYEVLKKRWDGFLG